jgi:hypothetical protein
MDTTVKVGDIGFTPEIPQVLAPQEEGVCSSGCKIGTLMFVGSMILVGGIIVAILLG